MKSLALILVCAMAASVPADDNTVYKSVSLGGDYTLIVKTREAFIPPDKNAPPKQNADDKWVSLLAPNGYTARYFVFMVKKGDKETSLEEISALVQLSGIAPGPGEPFQVLDTFFTGDKLGFIYCLDSPLISLNGRMGPVAVYATVDKQGGIHFMKETPLPNGTGTAKFRISDTGNIAIVVAEWTLPTFNGDGRPAHQETAVFELNAAGEFVKK